MKLIYYAAWWCQCGQIAENEDSISFVCPIHQSRKALQKLEEVSDEISEEFFDATRVNP